jgi:hypothetical protein
MSNPDVIGQYGLVYIDKNPPPPPSLKGDLWFNPEDGNLYIYTEPDWVKTNGSDGTADAMVERILAGKGIAVSPESGVGAVTVSSTATLNFVLTTGEEKPIPLS